MCQYLDSACFMANVFAACRDRSSITFTVLRKVRDDVANRLADQNVVIEWTRDSVMGALERYPNLFTSTGPEVTWLKSAEDVETVTGSFDAKFSDAFRGELRQAIHEVCKEVVAA